MISVTRRYTFDAAHRIPGHPTCGSLHGHTYTVDVTCSGLLVDGMVIDFHDMDATIGKWIKDHLDHALLHADGDRPESTGRCWNTIDAPTAEVIAEHILSVAREVVPAEVARVRVYETQRSWCDAS